MKATYKQRGESIDYVNGGSTTIEAGTVVALATRCGVAGTDIAAGATGTLHMNGVYEMAKDNSNITRGSVVYYDASADKVTLTAAGNTRLGFAVAAASTSATTVTVAIGVPAAGTAAVVAAITAADAVAAAGSAPTKAEYDACVAVANAAKAAVNSVLTAMKNAGLMANA